MKSFTVFGVFFFALLAVAHLLRLIFQTEILVDGERVPMWISVAGLVVTGSLALGIWRELRNQ